tara:strand:- start:1186 stop:1371 length:186 start_codon:yes stop_codon:yes gene_type:complete
MADQSKQPLTAAELEDEARREHGPRGTEAFKDNRGDLNEESELREGEERAFEKSLTNLPPG